MFSVIVPVHNKLPHLDRAIHSILDQTYGDFELLLIDDASTDGSSQKLKEYKDPRIRCFKRDTPGPGGYAARNLGIENAKYDWISFLDADDEWMPDFLEENLKMLKKYDTVQIVTCKHALSTDGKIVVPKGFGKIGDGQEFSLTDYFLFHRIMCVGSVVIKRNLLDEAGLFPAGKCNRGGDQDFFIRCLFHSKHNRFIDKRLMLYYRDTDNQVSNENKNPTR